VASRGKRSAATRAVVHVGLVVSAAVSLALETILAFHVLLGLAFVGLVTVHLGQRRRITSRLLARLRTHPDPMAASARIAVADLALLAVTITMLVSGIWDWRAGQPTTIRWHAISGVVLAGWLVLHTLRRRRRLFSSRIR
jgi:hypothetical protein